MNKELHELLQNNPAIWRLADKGVHAPQGRGTGFPQLDAILPGRGWPSNGLIEMVTPRWGVGELQLLLPLMKEMTQQGRWILWVAPPFIPYAPALAEAGINLNHVAVVQADSSCKDALWSIEKALQSEGCAMVLAWLDWLPNGVVRRLQLAAENGQTLGVLFRQREVKNSPAPIRLHIESKVNGIQVRTLKARGGYGLHGAYLNVH